MSYNVRYGSARDGLDAWPLRAGLAVGVVERRRPDLVGMQEVLDFQRRAFVSGLEGYQVFGVGRDADGGGGGSKLISGCGGVL